MVDIKPQAQVLEYYVNSSAETTIEILELHIESSAFGEDEEGRSSRISAVQSSPIITIA